MELKPIENLPNKYKTILSMLLEGNNRFVNNSPKKHDFKDERLITADDQRPEVIILGCSDSRVVPIIYLIVILVHYL